MKTINAIDRIYESYGLNLTLEEADGVYSLYEDSVLIVEGDFETVKGYVHGIEYGLAKKTTSSEIVINYFKQKVNNYISATVRKRARDTYYSQEIRNFKIKICSVIDNKIIYQADSFNTVSSGISIGGTNYSSPVMTFEIPVNVSMEDLKDKILDKMLIDLDNEMKKTLLERKKKRMIDYINTDMIINVTDEDLAKFSYINDKIVTVSFSTEYSL